MATKKTNTKASSVRGSNRPKPTVAKAGFTPGRRSRYPNGGKVCK